MIRFHDMFHNREEGPDPSEEPADEHPVEPSSGLEGLGRGKLEAERTEFLRRPGQRPEPPEDAPPMAEVTPAASPAEDPAPPESEATRTTVREPMGPGSADAPWATPEPAAAPAEEPEVVSEADEPPHVEESEDAEVELPEDPMAFMAEAMSQLEEIETEHAGSPAADADRVDVEIEVVLEPEAGEGVEDEEEVASSTDTQAIGDRDEMPGVTSEEETVIDAPAAAAASPVPGSEDETEIAPSRPEVDTRALKAAMGEANPSRGSGTSRRTARPKSGSIPRDVSAALDDLISGGINSKKGARRDAGSHSERVERLLEEERTEAAPRPEAPETPEAPAASEPEPQVAPASEPAAEEGGDWELSLDEVLKRYSGGS